MLLVDDDNNNFYQLDESQFNFGFTQIKQLTETNIHSFKVKRSFNIFWSFIPWKMSHLTGELPVSEQEKMCSLRFFVIKLSTPISHFRNFFKKKMQGQYRMNWSPNCCHSYIYIFLLQWNYINHFCDLHDTLTKTSLLLERNKESWKHRDTFLRKQKDK